MIKKSKKNQLTLVLVLIFSGTLLSQGDLTNMKKYWFYRHRLLNDFMVKGDCQGCSQALNERAFNTGTDGKWGDNTINLANYISILATEYELLSQQSQPTDSTIEELYFALKAFNRLDSDAEVSLPPHTRSKDVATVVSGGNLNGFFIRDDIYRNFLLDHPKLANGVTSSRQITAIQSDFIDPNPRWKEMSHDQVWHLMMGFALIRKYIPPGLSWQGKSLNNLDFNTDIWQEAENIMGRIINRIKNDGWVIYNPNTGLRVLRGPEVRELSYGAAEAACYVKNGNTSLDPGFPVHTCNDYHDGITYSTADLWMDFGHGYGTLIAISSEEDFKVQILAALGNSWWNRANPFLPDPYLVWSVIHDPSSFLHPFTSIATLVTATIPVPPTNVTIPELTTRALIRDYQHLPLLRQILHGGPNLIPSSYYSNLLDLGPCDGPHNFPGDMSTFEWSSSNRLHHPNHRGGSGNPGEYNGLDYMLYYNLYHIVAGTTVPNINYMDRILTLPFPTTGSVVVGTSALPATIEAFNTITASNVLSSTADVTYRAGTAIHFTPGFTVNAGANFHAYIDPFHCASGDYRSMTTNNDTSNQSTSDNLVAYNGPTTFVAYPKRINYSENIDREDNNLSPSNPHPIEYSNTLDGSAIASAPNSSTIISPNPNNGTFQITLIHSNQPIGAKEIEIMDMMGNIVWSTGVSGSSSFTVDISSYSPGIYYARCINSLNEIEIKKLIKK